MNGWLLVRIAGIVVGIATLLRVATTQGLVTYDPLFQQWMDRLRDLVELGFLTDVIKLYLDHGIEWVRSLGISLPDLQEEWRPAFVLSMLMFGAVSRHKRGSGWLLAAPVGALAIAVLSGLTGSFAPVALAALLSISLGAVLPNVGGYDERSYREGGVGNFIIFMLIGIAAMFLAVVPIGLVVVFIASTASLFLIAGISESWRGGLPAVVANASFNMGIDIFFVMLGALIIASLFANPPIW